MTPVHRERIGKISQGIKMGMNIGTFMENAALNPSGTFIFDMRDAKTGEQLAYFEKKNVITKDCGILAARLFRNSWEPILGTSTNKGLTMLSIGTGATGNILSPDAPQPEQRKINSQATLGRKPFSSAQFRDEDGVAVSYPTHIVDFTTTYSEGEATGPLNEMGLVAPFSADKLTTNWIDNGPGTATPTYDPTLDMSNKDLLANYLTFGVICKPSTAILTITWRLTF